MHTRKLLFLVVTIAMLFGLVAVVSAGSGTASVASRPGIPAWGPISVQPTGLDDPAWAGAPTTAVATWVHPAWASVTLDGAVWIGTSYQTETPIDTSWRKFHDEFVIPATAYGIGGNVKVAATADNAEAFYFDGVKIGEDGEVFGPSHDDTEWNSIAYYAVTPHTGTNRLDFIVRNYKDLTTWDTNPTGLLYNVSVDYSTPTVECLTPAVTFRLMAGADVVTTQPSIKVFVNGAEVTPTFANGAYSVPQTAGGQYAVQIYDGFVQDLPLGTCSYESDPSDGFVTAGGTIISPKGALAGSEWTGKASFGFTAKYHKGSTVPQGNVELQLHGADFNFKSTALTSLVITGNVAKIEGTGTVNGAGEYSFLITATDGDPDKVRFEIRSGATLVYDSGDLALNGGSIVIHK